MRSKSMPFMTNTHGFRDLDPIILDYLSLTDSKAFIKDYQRHKEQYQQDDISQALIKPNQFNLNESALTTYRIAVNLLEEKLIDQAQPTNKDQYLQFCLKNHDIFYRMINKFLDSSENFPDSGDLIDDCILHYTSIKHHLAWKLVQKAIINDNKTIVTAFLSYYSNLTELYHCARIETNLLTLMLDAPIEKKPAPALEWLQTIRMMLRASRDDKAILNGIRKIVKEIKAYDQQHKKLLAENFLYIGDDTFERFERYTLNHRIYSKRQIKYLSPIIRTDYQQKGILYFFAYDERNKSNHFLKYHKGDLLSINEQLFEYINQADIDTLLDIYNTHVNASYFENRSRFPQFFRQPYPQNKIDFIEHIQGKLLEQLKEKAESQTTTEILHLSQYVFRHPVFSVTHEKYGVGQHSDDANHRTVLNNYLASLEQISAEKSIHF